jgi:hypothetical protein
VRPGWRPRRPAPWLRASRGDLGPPPRLPLPHRRPLPVRSRPRRRQNPRRRLPPSRRSPRRTSRRTSPRSRRPGRSRRGGPHPARSSPRRGSRPTMLLAGRPRRRRQRTMRPPRRLAPPGTASSQGFRRPSWPCRPGAGQLPPPPAPSSHPGASQPGTPARGCDRRPTSTPSRRAPGSGEPRSAAGSAGCPRRCRGSWSRVPTSPAARSRCSRPNRRARHSSG